MESSLTAGSYQSCLQREGYSCKAFWLREFVQGEKKYIAVAGICAGLKNKSFSCCGDTCGDEKKILPRCGDACGVRKINSQKKVAGITLSTTVCHRLEWTGAPYRYLGCYYDTGGPFLGRTLPQGLDGRTGVGVDDCAAAARSRGFPLFALQGYGQCFFGSMADVQRSQQKLADGDCDGLHCPASAATCRRYVNKAYILIGMHIPLCAIELPISRRCHLCNACAWTVP